MKPTLAVLLGLSALGALALPLHARSLDETPLDQLTPTERLERRITPEVLVVRAATPAVVFIETNTPRVYRDFWGRTFSQNNKSSGSGVVLTTAQWERAGGCRRVGSRWARLTAHWNPTSTGGFAGAGPRKKGRSCSGNEHGGPSEPHQVGHCIPFEHP